MRGGLLSRLAVVCAAIACVAVLLVTVPAVSWASPDLPAGAPNTISGVVHDTHGAPVGCIVDVSHWDRDYGGWTTAGMGLSSPTDGSYVITGLPADTYRVEFLDIEAAWGFFSFAFSHRPQVYKYHDLTYMQWWDLTTSDSSDVTPDLIVVSPSAPGPTGVNGWLSPEPASISGHVRDESGNPIPGVSATLYGIDSGARVKALCSVPVLADGTYVFRGLVPDGTGVSVDESSAPRYEVGFSEETSGAWNAQYYGNTQSFASAVSLVCTGTELTGIDATLTPAPVCATGTVTDASTGLPLGDIVITADSEDPNPDYPVLEVNARTRDDGTYELRGLIPGREYSVGPPDLRVWDYAAAVVPHVVYSGQPVGGVDFALRPAMRACLFDGIEVNDADAQGEVRDQQYEDGYQGVTDVVVTPATTKYLADSVSASGLCWAYQVTAPGSVNLGKNAPMFAVPVSEASISVKQEIADIGLHNGTPDHRLTLRVVGTRASVPGRVLAGIRDYAASLGVSVTVDRLVTKANATRYDVAGAVAKRMKARADASRTDAIAMPDLAFVGNGDNASRLMESLACSALSAARGAPVLPVAANGKIPGPIARALKTLHLSSRGLYVVGRSSSVSEHVRQELRIPRNNRLQGPGGVSGRYGVAAAVASKALSMKWLRAMQDVAIATEPQDALAGGAAVGDAGGVLLLENPDSSEALKVTRAWVRSRASTIRRLWFVGFDAVRCYNSGEYQQLCGSPSSRRRAEAVFRARPTNRVAAAWGLARSRVGGPRSQPLGPRAQ